MRFSCGALSHLGVISNLSEWIYFAEILYSLWNVFGSEERNCQ